MFIAGADLRELGSAPPDAGHGPQAGAARPRPHRRLRGAAVPHRGRHRRRLHGRRPGAGAGLRLSPGQHAPEDRDRPAGDEDRPHPRLGRHAAADAADRPVAGRRDDLRRRGGQGRRAPASSASSSTPCRPSICSTRRVRLLQLGADSPDDWQEARRRKQQPVGLSEEQQAFTFAVARAQVHGQDRRPVSGAAGRPGRHRQGLQPAAGGRPEGRDRRSSCRWSAARSRATSSPSSS